MISFKDIELQDKELITSYTQNSPRRNCDLSFSNLCSWRFLYNTKFAIMDGFLLLKFWANDELVYMMPIGNGDLTKVLDALVEDAHRKGNLSACWEYVRACARNWKLHARKIPVHSRPGLCRLPLSAYRPRHACRKEIPVQTESCQQIQTHL